jgi:DNA polymerase-3 subunit alpha
MTDFCHLHNHTHYSLLDAACTVNNLVLKAKEYDHKAIALTDHGVMFGCMEFYHAAKKEGIKPLLGFEAYVATGSRFDKSSGKSGTKKKNYNHLLLLAKNKQGYQNLIKLTTLAHIEGFYYKPRIDEELIKQYSEGIIACSACINGVVNAHLVNDRYDIALTKAKFYQEVFGDDFYMEIQDHGLEEDPIILRDAPKIATELGIKLVATNDTHYISKEHAISHNIYLHIKDASKDSNIDIEELRYKVPQMYYKTTDEMYELFKEHPAALASTQEIADKCDFSFEKGYFLPHFPLPDTTKAKTLGDYLTELTMAGLKERYKDMTPEVMERADYELKVIEKMGFPGYFLIVHDFIQAAKRMGVRVGPGRGSAAGSIVAYALGITNVDPLPYNLLFERFLNPERVSMPDIDIDFSDNKREKVIRYVKEKYGEDCVAQIITFGTLSTKAVLKDVGRVLGIHYSEINEITTKIPTILGKVKELNKAVELPEIKTLIAQNKGKYDKLLQHSLLLEGLFRHTGIHAAGVVITPGKVDDYVPLYSKPGKDGGQDIATQYGMKDLEKAGILKMDFLGLATLSIIDNTLDMIEVNHGVRLDIDDITFDDPDTYDIFCSGRTLGIFQFESDAMKEHLTHLKPRNILEITAMNALYRPGPMENIPDFIDRKQGRKDIEYVHPVMEKVLAETYGVIVYQEQVMQLARDIGGFSLGQADVLRRAMGKKDSKAMADVKTTFIDGAVKNGFDRKLSDEIYQLIEKFASYGFNKSHSLAYSVLAYQTAWLKAHYPAEFIAANMTSELMKTDPQIVGFMQEAKLYGIEVVPPDVNNSEDRFVVRNGVIYFSLAAVKNVGVSAAEGILRAREEKLFESYFDFIQRVEQKYVNRKVLEALICSGTFDSLKSANRATLFNGIDIALDFSRALNSKDSGMDSLFGGSETQTLTEPRLNEFPDWSEKDKLIKEKEFLSFYVTGNPIEKYIGIIDSLSTLKMSEYNSRLIGEQVRVCGLVSELRTRLDKKSNPIAFAKMEDSSGRGELVFWSKAWSSCKELVREDVIIVCIGKAETDTNGVKIIVNSCMPLFEGAARFGRGISLLIERNESTNLLLEKFSSICSTPGSESDVIFNIYDKSLNNNQSYHANVSGLVINESTINKLIDIFGQNNVKLISNM